MSWYGDQVFFFKVLVSWFGDQVFKVLVSWYGGINSGCKLSLKASRVRGYRLLS